MKDALTSSPLFSKTGVSLTSGAVYTMFMYNGAFVYFRIGYIAAAALIVLVVVVAICMALARPIKRFHG